MSPVNPFAPKSDKHLISSYNITPESHSKVMKKKKEVITSVRLLIVELILLVSTSGNVKRTVWRICISMLGCKGLSHGDSVASRK